MKFDIILLLPQFIQTLNKTITSQVRAPLKAPKLLSRSNMLKRLFSGTLEKSHIAKKSPFGI